MGTEGFIYIPHTYKGHRPSGLRVIEQYQNGCICTVRESATMSFGMRWLVRTSLAVARTDAKFHNAGDEVIPA